MKLGYTIIYVQSVPDTLAFYKAAFNIPARFCVPTNDYAELDLGGTTTLAFADEQFVTDNIGTNVFRPNRLDYESAAGAEISLVVEVGETVEGVVKRAVEAGAVLVREPTVKPWGQLVAYLKDCNGFLVEICTPVEGT